MERRGGWYGMETCVVDGARCVPLPARSRAIYMLHGHPRTSRFALMYGVMEVASCGRVSLRRLRALSSTLLCHLSAARSSPHIPLRSDVRGYGGGVLRTRVSLRRLRALSSSLLCHLSAARSSPHISLRSDVRGYGGGVLRTRVLNVLGIKSFIKDKTQINLRLCFIEYKN